MPSHPLLCLPRELLTTTLTFLQHEDILRCRGVCRTLRTTIDDSVALLYQVQLEIEGLIDSSKGSLCTADRLKLLLERRDRWLRMNWAKVVTLTPTRLIPETPLPYELQGGTFFNVTAHAGKFSMNMTRLPSIADPTPEYENKEFDSQFVDITVDPSQDLMVVLDLLGRLHVWSLSTLEAHPLAQKPVLREEGTAEARMTGLSIAYDLVAIVEWTGFVSATIWNWKTGAMILHGHGLDLPYLITGLTWLSSDKFVVADADTNSLLLFSLSAYDCVSPATPYTFDTLFPYVRLQLPPVHDTWHLSFFQLESTPLLATVPRDRPFIPALEHNIVVFTLQYATMDHTQVTGRFLGFVHNHHLVSHLSGGGPPPERLEDIKVVPWEEWGPQNTRLLRNNYSRATYARYVHGQRVVYPGTRDMHDGNRVLFVIVLDFNVHPKRLESIIGANGRYKDPFDRTNKVEVVHNPEVLEHRIADANGQMQTVPQSPFVEVVTTHLPYIKTSRPVDKRLEKRMSHFMMDDERLIELNHPVTQDDTYDAQVRVYTF
ncbi:hypothetical protein L226DRAFT_554804 [Lentinus tigrinus ALCF2SS1-7]|uniref:F-box domain-containing protein n=1 Tax=Lentinus tigrinus ALCF2SS1-6 TaxID=1328759 RepID=A0A5C2RRW7_9APHY|nr:hypothetical protein L227DRAFT_596169 [Lentinus tigrinus ALCF2SS1-6]RPD70617.1 hypothetical protein L226DRAFT_554804 [Lentinus tigrinus ALCF2SS1-7]